MKRETFNTQFVAMASAYPHAADKITPEMQDVYWEMLKGIPDEKFIAGVRECLSRCKFFPTIAELGDASRPPRLERAPYNPYVYQEPRQVGWQEQLQRQERAQISEHEKKLLDDLRRDGKDRA